MKPTSKVVGARSPPRSTSRSARGLAATGASTSTSHCGSDGQARDAIGFQMVPGMLEISSLARGSNRILRPTEKGRDLSNVERPDRILLEHRWNTNVVHPRGPLVNRRLARRGAARMISLGWGRLVTVRNGWRLGLIALPRRRSPVRIWCSLQIARNPRG